VNAAMIWTPRMHRSEYTRQGFESELAAGQLQAWSKSEMQQKVADNNVPRIERLASCIVRPRSCLPLPRLFNARLMHVAHKTDFSKCARVCDRCIFQRL